MLTNDGKEALLLSKYALNAKPYNDIHEEVTWETCSLRSWLNTEFYDTAFSSSEKKEIKLTHLENKDNPYSGTPGGKNTEDKVFLMSLDDMNNNGYSFDTDFEVFDINRRCAPTAYAEAYGCMRIDSDWGWGASSKTVEGLDACNWWLRSPSERADCASDVYGLGYVSSNGHDVDHGDVSTYGLNAYFGVRPTLYISLELESEEGRVIVK